MAWETKINLQPYFFREVEKKLADGDEGIGGLAEDITLIEAINKLGL